MQEHIMRDKVESIRKISLILTADDRSQEVENVTKLVTVDLVLVK
jgi:hypothetical protein